MSRISNKKSILFRMAKFGDFLGSRDVGRSINSELINLLNKYEEVEVDFSGISIISQSFADECFGKLAVKVGQDNFKKVLVFSNINDDIYAIINFVVADRFKK